MKRKYCTTIMFKIAIAQFVLNFIGLTIGYMWGINIENKKWSQLIYRNVKIADFDLGGKTKEEAKKIIKSQYIDQILKKRLYVTVDDKVYSIENSRLIKSYNIENVVDQAFNFGKDLSIIEKHKLIKNGSYKDYNLDFTCDDNFIREFTKNIDNEINKEPLKANIKMKAEGTIKIGTEVKGYRLEKEQLEKYIENKIKAGINQDIYIKAPVKHMEAAFSSVDTNISSFSTSFETSSIERASNINISAKAIDGTFLMPGQGFSFNQVVGERTKERGYMEAPIIIGNKVESGIGGGICQVSSTLYNAVLRTGIQSIERVHHSLPSTYVGLGLDATINWSDIDFKFKNTLDYPIYIEAYTENKNLYINIFSNSSAKKRKYVVENNIYEILSPTIQTIYEPNLQEEKTFSYEKAHNGYRVKVIRKTYDNEVLLGSEIISDDLYAPVAAVPKKVSKK